MKSQYFSFLKTLLKSKRAFSVIGVLMASSIGIVLVMGLNQMLSNIVGTIKSVDDRSRRVLFNERLTETICEKIPPAIVKNELLKAGQYGLADGAPAVLKTKRIPLRDMEGFTESSLRAEHNIYGDSYVDLSSSSESCAGKSSGCTQNWEMKLVTQGKSKGVYIYEKPLFFDFDVTWTNTGAVSPEFTCAGLAEVKGAEKLDCLTLETGGSRKILVGCGKTQDIGGTNTIVMGYDIGSKTTGNANLFLGFEAGKWATVSGASNTFLAASSGLSVKALGSSNAFLGNSAGQSATVSGASNVFLGAFAGQSATVSGASNVFLGNYAGVSAVVSKDANAFLGNYAGYQAKVKGPENIFIGSDAGREATVSKDYNIFLGYQAGYLAKVSGGSNAFFIDSAGREATVSGNSNTFLGAFAGLQATVSGSSNTFLGYQAGYLATVSGYSHSFLGNSAGREATVSGYSNSFLGALAGQSAKGAGSSNTFLGYTAGLRTDLDGNGNTLLGSYAGEEAKGDGNNNTFLGYRAGLKADIDGDGNLFLGHRVAERAEGIKGNFNAFLGVYSGSSSKIESDNNLFLGEWSGNDVEILPPGGITIPDEPEGTQATSGNIFIGNNAGTGSKVASRANIFIGPSAGSNSVIGDNAEATLPSVGRYADANVFIGTFAGRDSRVDGRSNFFVGRAAGREAKVRNDYNTFFGFRAGYKATIGNKQVGRTDAFLDGGNTFFGADAGRQVSITGDNDKQYNTFLGYKAGERAEVEGKGNTFLGYRAGERAEVEGDHNTFVGAGSGVPVGAITADNVTDIAGRILALKNTSLTAGAYNGLTKVDGSESKVKIAAKGGLWVCDDSGSSNSCKKVKTDSGSSFSSSVDSFRFFNIASSKVYKRDIKLFSKFEKALEDILETPLFNYNYKESYGDHPEKRRMGIIAEELPENLQIKDDPVKPDWPSIYGTLWAGIKALHAQFVGLRQAFFIFKNQMLAKLDSLRKEFMQELASVREQNILQTTNVNQELKDVKAELELAKRELADIKAEFRQFKEQAKRDRN